MIIVPPIHWYLMEQTRTDMFAMVCKFFEIVKISRDTTGWAMCVCALWTLVALKGAERNYNLGLI